MSKLFIEDTTLSAIGDAIRTKGGTADKIAPLDMPTAITNLPSGGSVDWSKKTVNDDKNLPFEIKIKTKGTLNGVWGPYREYELSPIIQPGNFNWVGFFAYDVQGQGNTPTLKLFSPIMNSFNPDLDEWQILTILDLESSVGRPLTYVNVFAGFRPATCYYNPVKQLIRIEGDLGITERAFDEKSRNIYSIFVINK